MFTQEFVDKFGLQDFFNDNEKFTKVIVKKKRSFGYREDDSENLTMIDEAEINKQFIAYRFTKETTLENYEERKAIIKEIKKLILERSPQSIGIVYDNESDKQFNKSCDDLFEISKETGYVNTREEWDEYFKSLV